MEIQTSTNMLWSAVKVSSKIKSRTAIQFQWRQGFMKVMLVHWNAHSWKSVYCSESESEVVQQIQCHMKKWQRRHGRSDTIKRPKIIPPFGGGGVSKLKISYFLTLQMQIWFILALSSWEKDLTDDGRTTTTNAYPYLSTHVTLKLNIFIHHTNCIVCTTGSKMMNHRGSKLQGWKVSV